MTHIGTILKILREMKPATQDDLAEATGVSQQTVSRWEKGESSPTQEQLEKAGNYLGISMETMMQLREGKANIQISNNANDNVNGINIQLDKSDTNVIYEELIAQQKAHIADLQQQVADLRQMLAQR